ncbi:MAG: phospho-sugar mutase [Coprobacillus sp.]
MIKDIQFLYHLWLNNTKDEDELFNELSEMTEQDVEEAFYKDIKFGTGGIRGIMGAGPNRLNIYTVRKVAQGFTYYIQEHGGYKDGIVIGYDNRKNSEVFARTCAEVLATHNIKVYLFDTLRPTPELSFTIRELHAFGGIVITASHNPKVYNGLKFYNCNGCQCVPRESDVIISYINKVKDVFSIQVDKSKIDNIHMISTSIDERYYEALMCVEENTNINKDNLKIVYTPLHGTGYIPVTTMLKRLGYQVECVEEQCIPYSDFRYATSINPENRKSFDRAIYLAMKKNADLIIATDPDCDRLGIAILHEGVYHYLTGNQTGAILLNYLLSQKSEKGTLPNDAIVLNTIVTSSLGARICEKYDVEIESTLTGFKYIGDKIEAYQGEKTFLFGYEESYGYLIKDFVRDKDGVQSSIIIAEVCAFYKEQGKTLVHILHEIYDEFGYVVDSQENKIYKGKAGLEEIERIMDTYRNEVIDTMENRKVIAKEDYKLSKRFVDGKVETLNLPKSNVIKLYLDDGSWVVIRPSGNEPKIKLYKDLLKHGNL